MIPSTVDGAAVLVLVVMPIVWLARGRRPFGVRACTVIAVAFGVRTPAEASAQSLWAWLSLLACLLWMAVVGERSRTERIRKRAALLRVLRDTKQGMSVHELAKASGASSAFVHRELTRLNEDGQVRWWWGEPQGAKQLRRRFYALTDREVHR